LKALISLIVALMVTLPSLAQAYDVLVVMSRRNPVLEEVLKGFRSGTRFSERVLVLSDYDSVDLSRIVREDHPSLVLALGDQALAEAGKLQKPHVVALMSLGIHMYDGSPNVTGIDMFAAPKGYLEIFRRMKAKRVGVICDPDKSGWYLRQAQQEARRAGIDLVVREVRTSRETPAQFTSLKGKIDALWMWPDTTTVTRDTVEYYANFSLEQQVPLISFASDYLKIGAAAAKVIDFTDLGKQANALAAKILGGAAPADLPIASPRRVIFKSNPAILKRLGISVNDMENMFSTGEE